MSPRNSTADELMEHLRAASDELASLKILADSDDQTSNHLGNLDMAESYVNASLNSLSG